MSIKWTKHAVQRCWHRMKLSDERNIGLFDERIKKNLRNKIHQKNQEYLIPFKIAGQCYIAAGVINCNEFVIKTIMDVSREKYKTISRKQTGWINERRS